MEFTGNRMKLQGSQNTGLIENLNDLQCDLAIAEWYISRILDAS